MKRQKVGALLGLLAAMTVSPLSAARVDWPQFQLDAQHSAFNSAGAIRVPLQPAWTATLAGGWDFSSAVVANGVVYAGSINGQLAAFDQRTGRQLWTYTTAGSIHLAPAVSAGRVVFGSADGNLIAVDAASGSLIWSLGVGSNLNSSPNLSGGVVYVGANDGNAYAVDATSGAVIWRQNVGNYLLASPAISGQQVVFATVDGRVLALDKGTGATAWTATVPAEVRSSPAVSGGLIYIGAHDGVLRALNAGTGAVAWSAPYPAPIFNGVAVSTFAVYTASLDGKVTALDKATGNPLWMFDVHAGIHAAPTVIGNAVVIGCENGALYVLDAASGADLYQTTLPGRVAGPAALSLGRVYVLTDDGTLSAFSSPNQAPSAPLVLAVNGGGAAISTSSAAFSWTFVDPDAGDAQSEFRLAVATAAGLGAPFFDTGVEESSATAFQLAGPLAEGRYSWEVQTYDLFGDSSPFSTATFVVDRTAPQVRLGSPLGGERFVAVVSTINVSFTIIDNLDPAATSQAYLVELQHQGGPSGGLPTRLAVSSGSAISPLSIDSGLWQLQVTATDWAGNSTSTVSGAFQVIHDLLPPRTSLVVGAPEFSSGTLTYATDITTFGLVAVDDLATVGDGAGLGVATTYLSIDGGAFGALTSTFSLAAEGLHTAQFYSVDTAGNQEAVSTAAIAVDLTAPVTQLQVGGPSGALASGGIGVSSAAVFSLSSNDPSVNGAASGVASVFYVIDQDPFSPGCQGTPLDPAAAPGTCANESYFGPFSLTPGAHTVYFLAEDAVGNQETVHIASVTVDALPPRTSLAVGSPQADSGSGLKYVTRQTVLNLTSVDDLAAVGDSLGLGVSTQTLLVDGVARAAFAAASSSFTLSTDSDGVHALGYFAQDVAGNLEPVHVTTVAVDGTAPLTQLATSGGKTFPGSDGSTFYASSATLFGFAAADPIVNGAAAGVAWTRWQDNGGAFQAFASSFSLAEGAHRLAYQSQDRVQNLEVARSTTVIVDATPPASSIAFGSPFYAAPDGSNYVAPTSSVTLSAADPALQGGQAGSGVGRIEVSVDGGAFTTYSAALTFAEGTHAVSYRAVDNVGNVEAAHTLSLKSDATPPGSTLQLSGPVSSTGTAATGAILSAAPANGLPIACSGFGMVAYNARAYVAGCLGTNAPSVYSAPINADGSFGAWVQEVNQLPFGIEGGPGMTQYGGRLYFAGGYNYVSGGAQNAVWMAPVNADGSVGVWVRQTHSLPTPVNGNSLVASNGRLFSAGGSAYASGSVAAVYSAPINADGSVGAWIATTALPQPLSWNGLVAANGYLISVGGAGASTPASAVYSAAINADGSLGAWTSEAPLPLALGNTRATAVLGDRVYLAGGCGTAGCVQTIYSAPLGAAGAVGAWRQEPVGLAVPMVNAELVSWNSRLIALGGDSTGKAGFTMPVDATPASGGFVSASTVFSLGAADAVSGGVASGVAFTRYRVNGGAFTQGPLSFELSGTDGSYTVDYQSQDNVGNLEALRSMTVFFDRTAPVSAAHVGGPSFIGPDGTRYVTPATPVTFTAVDPSSGAASGSGVDHIEAAIDGGSFSIYTATLTFAEGRHTVLFRSIDRVGNVETAQTLSLQSDSTPPVTAFAFGTPYDAATDGTNYVAPATPLTFSASDPALPTGQAGAGVARVEVSIDSGAFTVYAASLTFAEGAHTVSYRSVDNVGNVEPTRTLSLKSDATPPVSTLALSTSAFGSFVSASTLFSLSAVDPVSSGVVSGVAFSRYRVNGGAFAQASLPFGLTGPDGPYTIDYQSQDHVQNLEGLRSLSVILDQTPPVTTARVGASSFTAADGTQYVTPTTPVTFSAVDPGTGGASAGYQPLPGTVGFWHLDGAANGVTPDASGSGHDGTLINGPAFVPGQVGNAISLNGTSQFVDAGTGAMLNGSASFTIEAWVNLNPGYNNQYNNVIHAAVPGRANSWFMQFLPPAENGVGGMRCGAGASGVAALVDYAVALPVPAGAWSHVACTYNGSAASFQLYVNGVAVPTRIARSDFSGAVADGGAVDVNIGAAPGGGMNFDGKIDEVRVLNAVLTPAQIAADAAAGGSAAASGVGRIETSVDGGAFAAYTTALTFAEGRHTVSYRAIDNVGNVEAPRTLAIQSDGTPPATTLAASGTYFTTTAGNYAPPSFAYALSAQDPVSAGVASGLAAISYRIDGSSFATYASSFGLTEGVRRVDFQGRDNVGNTELLKSATVFVDATPPASALGIGSPKFDAGSNQIYVAPATPLSLSAQDPLVNGVASGVGSINFRRGSDAFAAYQSSFTLAAPDGAKTLAWYATDNVGNAEASRAASLLLDGTAPQTSLVFVGGRQFGLYVSSDTRIALPAADPVVGSVASGVAFTQYQDNGGAFVVYASTIVLGEGAHVLAYQSQDRVANLEVLRSTAVWIDATAPVSTFTFGSPYYQASDGTDYVTPATSVTFSAGDPALPTGQPGSGVSRLEVSIDGAPFAAYSAPLSFVEGRHSVLFRATDNVGNVEGARALNVQSDATAPQTELALSGGKQAAAGQGSFYASPDTRVGFAAVDPVVNGVASGLAFTRYQDGAGAPSVYSAPFSLSEGSHTITYQSQDNVRNAEVSRSTTVFVDSTAPKTTVTIGAPLFVAADGTRFVTPATPVSFSAVDPQSGGVASGIDRIEVDVDGGGFAVYASTLTFAEGRHTVAFRAVDRVGNVETAQSLALQSDNTPPVTTLGASGAYFAANGDNFAPLSFSYSLTAQDPSINGVASGVASTVYRVDAASFTAYASTFSLVEGIRRIEFQSRDNVGNVELLKSATVFVDATPPASALAIGGPRFDPGAGQPVMISPSSLLTLSAVDPVVQSVASGVKGISFRRGADAFAAYSAPIGMPAPDGVKTLDYFALDNVGNQEIIRSTAVALDGTAPLTSLLVVGGRQFAGPNLVTFYASSDTRLALPAIDPVVNGVASGLALTRWQDNGGSYQTYVSTLALAEGAHALGYQSQDNVQNLEVLRSTNVWIDAAAPVSTFTFGAPYYQAADGTNYVTPATSVTFSAADPALPTGQPGSGVSRIEVAVDGAAFAPYTAALSFGEGRHSVVFRSIDNVGNVEIARVLQVQSDATPPASALVVGAPQYQLPNALLVSARTPFAVSSVDPAVNGVASGVKDIWYEVNDVAASTGAFQPFSSSFTLSGADVGKTIQFYSRDNVLNVEVVKSSTVLLDSTPPSAAILSPGPQTGGVCAVVKGKIPVLGTATDPHFAGYVLASSPGQNASTGFATFASASVAVTSGTLGTWDTTALSGWQTLRLSATDLVANVSTAAVNVAVGDPAEPLVLGSHDLFDMPQGVAPAPSGGAAVADTNDDQIKVFSSSGAQIAVFGDGLHDIDSDGDEGVSTSSLRFNKPRAVAIDASGNYYVADSNNDRIVSFTPAGQMLISVGRQQIKVKGNGNAGSRVVYKPGNNPGEFNKPSGIAVDAAGKIYVADTLNHRVQVLSSTGAVTLVFSLPAVSAPQPGGDDDDDGGAVGMPHGIALDAAGRIYVADPKGSRALVFSSSGQLMSTILVPSGAPYGIASDASGQCVAVSDRKNARVLVFDAQGGQKLSFGAQGKISDTQGPTSSIVFNKPSGLAMAADGTLLVADRNNDRVERFAAPTGQSQLVVPPPAAGSADAARDVVDKDAGGAVARGDGAGVSVPAGALAQDLKISVSTLTAGNLFQVALMNGQADKNGLSPAYAPVQFMPEGTQFASPATLTMPYNPLLLAQEGISEDALKIEYWNPNLGSWQALDSTIDKINHIVTAKTSHFSTYQVLGSTGTAPVTLQAASDRPFVLGDVYAYPNPSRPGQSPTIHVDAGSADQVEIHIYDLSGALKTSASLSGPQLAFDYRWSVSNIGSGVYIYVVTATKAGSGKLRHTGRLAVIK